jgi:predicted MFS family arabinose efflux permease
VPRTYGNLLCTYAVLYTTIVFTSTTLGGVMVEVGMRHGAVGRLTAQRIGMFRLASLAGGPIGGMLASSPFGLAMAITAALHLILVPLYYRELPEARGARANRHVWREAGAQGRGLLRSKTLLGAAGMICLVAIAPGFGTPLLFHQTNTLHFSKQFIGNLILVGAASGLAGAWLYHAVCRRLRLRSLLAGSIVVHALGTLFYLAYHSHASALWITALSGLTGTLAFLPIYDLAARATPRGGEALGYSVMMSVWNLTNAVSDWSGSWLYGHFHLTFLHLVWLNAGTTALALLAIPFLPVVLLTRRDGAAAAS